MSMGKVGQSLKRKFGPFPAAVWLLILAGGIYYWRHHQAAAAVSTGTAAGVSAGAGTGTGTSSSSGDLGGGAFPDTQPFNDQLPPAYQQQGGPVTFDPSQTGGDVSPTAPDTTTSTVAPSPATTTTPAGSVPGVSVPAGFTSGGFGGGIKIPSLTDPSRFIVRKPTKFRHYLGGLFQPKRAPHKGKPAAPRAKTSTAPHKARPAGRPVSVRSVPVRSHTETPPAPHRAAPVQASRTPSAPRAHAARPTLSPARQRAFDHAVGLHTFTAPAPKPAPAPVKTAPARIATAPAAMSTAPAHLDTRPAAVPKRQAKPAPPHPTPRHKGRR